MCFRPTGLVKNLKCPECGTLNLAGNKKCKSCQAPLDAVKDKIDPGKK